MTESTVPFSQYAKLADDCNRALATERATSAALQATAVDWRERYSREAGKSVVLEAENVRLRCEVASLQEILRGTSTNEPESRRAAAPFPANVLRGFAR